MTKEEIVEASMKIGDVTAKALLNDLVDYSK